MWFRSVSVDPDNQSESCRSSLCMCVSLRSASSIVMMNLALSDSSFALTLPLRLAYYFKGGVWDFPDWVCRLCVYGFYVNLYTR